jgi:dipeptidase
MCDTFVALADATADGSLILAKNSDREPNEAAEVVLVPAASHAAGATLACTYLEISQVRRTHAVLLSKPYWIWGAEMGANEHGVVIGNEAVFTKGPHDDEPGLIGMDLLRLALERADSAEAALEVIVALLAEYGQGGNCGHTATMRYDNSFLISDPSGAWVLETAGREWAAARATSVRTISNAITIGAEFDRSSDALVSHAVDRGWCRGAEDFDFGGCYSDALYTRFSDARKRQCRTTDCLADRSGAIDVATAFSLLRDHGLDSVAQRATWGPSKSAAGGLLGQTVCMHAGYGPVRINQSTASWVSHLAADGTATHWVTGTSAPCTSVFKPVWFDGGLPDTGPRPDGTYDRKTLWWSHEDLHRTTLRDYPALHPRYSGARDELELRFIEDAASAATPASRSGVSTAAFQEASAAETAWLDDVRAQQPAAAGGLFGRAWRSFDRAGARPGQTV